MPGSGPTGLIVCVDGGGGALSGRRYASEAASNGIKASTTSVGSMPYLSALAPMIGTNRLPIPHANPIISDDTVAAPPLTKLCANVTLIGSVDCSNSPPTASSAVKPTGDKRGATAMNGTAATSDQKITRRGPWRSASGPPMKPPTPLANK